MKGYIDEYGRDMSPCKKCKYSHKMTVEAPCYNCISLSDLALHKPNCETEFVYFEENTNTCVDSTDIRKEAKK